MNDLFRDMLSDLLPLLVPFLSATLLSLLSFFLERIHPELRDTTASHRRATWERALEATSRYLDSSANAHHGDASADTLYNNLRSELQTIIRDTLREELDRVFQTYMTTGNETTHRYDADT